MWWTDSPGRIELKITLADAESCYHPGPCDMDVADLRTKPSIQRQLAKLDPATVKSSIQDYGAWDDDDLADHEANLDRLLWIACCDISEEAFEKGRG